MQSHDTENEDQRKNKHNDGIDLESWGFVGVEFYLMLEEFNQGYSFPKPRWRDFRRVSEQSCPEQTGPGKNT